MGKFFWLNFICCVQFIQFFASDSSAVRGELQSQGDSFSKSTSPVRPEALVWGDSSSRSASPEVPNPSAFRGRLKIQVNRSSDSISPVQVGSMPKLEYLAQQDDSSSRLGSPVQVDNSSRSESLEEDRFDDFRFKRAISREFAQFHKRFLNFCMQSSPANLFQTLRSDVLDFMERNKGATLLSDDDDVVSVRNAGKELLTSIDMRVKKLSEDVDTSK